MSWRGGSLYPNNSLTQASPDLRKEGSVAWVLAGEGWSKYYEVLPRKLEQQDSKQRGALFKTKGAFL